MEPDEGHEHRVKLVARASYGDHYRRIVPAVPCHLAMVEAFDFIETVRQDWPTLR